MMTAFSDVFADVTKQGTKLQTSEYLPSGKYPIIDQGQDDIAGYTDREDGLFTDVPAIIFGDHTRIVKYVDMPFFLGADGVKVLKATIPDVDCRYLYYAVSAVKIPNTGYNRHFKWLKEAQIPLPDISTQRRIADTLDKVSEGIEVCRKMLGELDLMVKAKFGEMFGNIPETEFVTMGSVCSLITDGTHQPPKFVDSGIPFLFVSNITTNMLTYNAEKFISAETYAELMKRTPVEIGDILLSTVGSYGHPAIVKSNKQFSFQRHIAFLKPRHNIIDSTFLHSAILTAGVQRQIEAKVKGIAQKTLNLSEIRTLRFPLPPLQEQERYAALVKNINKSKLTIQEIRDKMETEKLALMQGYFG